MQLLSSARGRRRVVVVTLHGVLIGVLLGALLGLAACLGSGPVRGVDPVLVELEAPSARTPDDGTFARATAARWASGRECATAFFGQGRAEWILPVPRAGEGTLWLRYAARSDVALPFGWGGLDEAELEPRELPGTGATSGKHAWGWAALDRISLAAGEQRFTLGAAPLRLDCVVLAGEERPTWLDPAAVRELSAQERARLAGPLSPASPPWLAAFAGLEPPRWYDRTRMCLHTRFGPPWVEREAFRQVAAGFHELGARSYVRHLHTRGEGLWWPSETGPSAPWGTGTLARELVAAAHERDLRLVAYYRHLEDSHLAETQPRWCCRDDLGAVRMGRNGAPRICLNSPYLELLEARLVELAELGVDGVYFDEDHWPRDGCWCEACVRGFEGETGLDMPARVDEEDPRYRRLLEFGAVSMERSFARLHGTLRAVAPDLALLIGSNRAVDPMEHFGSDRLWRIADGVKTEYGKGHGVALRLQLARRPELEAPARDAWLALGWAFARDAAEGRPPHVWANAIPDAEMAQAATAALIAHGCVANLDCKEAELPDLETFGAAVALGNQMSDALAGARPERSVVVHWPGALREQLTGEEVFARVALPLGVAFEHLLRARRSAGVITDSLLAEGALDGVRALLLPAPEALTPRQRAALADFEQAGGLVVRHRDGWDFTRLDDLDAPWSVTGGTPRMHAVGHVVERASADGTAARRGLVLALTNDPGWVYTDPRVSRAGRPLTLPPGVDVLPAACDDVVVRVPIGTSEVLDVLRGGPLELVDGRVRVPAFQHAALLLIR